MWVLIGIAIVAASSFLAVALLQGGAYYEDEHASMFDRV